MTHCWKSLMLLTNLMPNQRSLLQSSQISCNNQRIRLYTVCLSVLVNGIMQMMLSKSILIQKLELSYCLF